MCGRYFLEVDFEDILSFYGVKSARNEGFHNGQIYPGTNIPVIYKRGTRRLDYFRWGFKIEALNKEVINARFETIEEKPTFKKAYYENRCLIPANSFYEWNTELGNKIKYKIGDKNNYLFSMAGIFSSFIDKNNNIYNGVVILTKPASKDMDKIHHRMPVFIGREEEEIWLSNKKLEQSFKNKLMNSNTELNISPEDGIEQISMLDLF